MKQGVCGMKHQRNPNRERSGRESRRRDLWRERRREQNRQKLTEALKI